MGGIPGAIAMGTAVIYDIEEWSLLRATVTHFLIVMVALLLACFVLKWFEPWSAPFWIMLAAELVGYIIIWLIMYLCYKKQVRKLNNLLKENRKKE
jgi:CDP-diglyceride synthetase